MHMLRPGLHNTQYTCNGRGYAIHSIRGDTIPQRCPSFWSPCGLDGVSLTEDSSATFGGIHQSKGNRYVLIEMVRGRAGENADSAHSAYLNICDENFPTLAFGEKIILRHVKDVRPASLCLSLISSFAYEVLAWLTRLWLILQHL